ncbi:MAG: hypothetical protein H6730_05200 [Deltaproteobacteria bacterium]|nr:hypothetical protein [Deltaproteobacteria bacterium]
MQARPSQKLQLPLLRTLGLPEDQVSQIRDQLHRTNDLLVNGAGQVTISAVEQAAAAVEAAGIKAGARLVPFPAEAVRKLLAPVGGDLLKVGLPADFPVPSLSARAAVEHPDTLGAEVGPAALGSAAEAAQAFLQKAAPELAQRLIDGKATVGDLGRALGTQEARAALGEKLDVALTALGKAGAPAASARDLVVNVDSRFSKLDGAGEVAVFQRRYLDHLSVKRDKDPVGGFTVHGFERDDVLVTVPKGATVVLMDGAGNQQGAYLRPSTVEIEGAKHNAVTISRSLVQHPDAKAYTRDPTFGVRVIDAQGEVLYERSLQFDKGEAWTSKRVFSGRLEHQPAPEPALTALWDHAVPDPRANPAPLGERPLFQLEGQPSGDRVRIQRDGKSFDLSRLVQFLAPPKAAKQDFRVGGTVVSLEPRSSNSTALTDGEYDPTAGGKLRTSHGHGITFDPSLFQTRQARWGSEGITVYEVGMRKPLATFDPLRDAAR